VRSSARVKGMNGPMGWPLIGNLWHIRTNAAEQYRLWSKTHGAVFQIQLGNVPVVVVNSAASAKVLFGQNAQALSSRPEFYTFHKVGVVCRCRGIVLTVHRLCRIPLGRRSGHHRIVIP
jgi:3-hydroxyphenylacetate 6-hydroxylase